MAKKLEINWRGPGGVIEHARDIVAQYDTGVTLRQVFYRLVAAQLLPNEKNQYQYLSKLTAQFRRAGTFPALIDETRTVDVLRAYESPDDALRACVDSYRTDRTAGQPGTLILGVEKAALRRQLWGWFGHFGFPMFAARGYASETFAADLEERIRQDERPTVMLYAGDFDPSGWNIATKLQERMTAAGATFVHLGLHPAQIRQHELPVSFAKKGDTRNKAFTRQFGAALQVELDALDVDDLRTVYAEAIALYWNADAYEAAMEREHEERATLQTIVGI